MSAYNFAKEQQNKTFFHSEELTLFDKWSISIYLIMTIVVAIYYDRIDVGYAHFLIILYAGGLQMFIYLILYISLRNFRCYLIWFGFSMIHLAMYFVMKDDKRLLSLQGSPVALLRNTFVLLLFFQVLRYISLKTQHIELVSPSKASYQDFFNTRKVTLIDKALFVAYCAVLGTLVYFSFPDW
jgi:hypothetical protein